MPVCYVPIIMHGCGLSGGLLLTWGVSIQIKSGSTVLFSGTTDGTGTLLVPVGGSGITPGTYTVVATDGRGTPRWNSQSFTFLNFACPPVTKNLQMTSPLAAYICLNCCADPVKRIMTFTSTKFGTWTGDWVSTGPSSGFSVTGCGPCTYPVHVYPGLNSSAFPCTATVAVRQDFPTSCPDNLGDPNDSSCININYTSSVSMTCPPAFSWTGSASITTPLPAGTCGDRLLCSTYPWTDTMTASE